MKKKGGGQTWYCEMAFVGVPCESILGEQKAICPLVNYIRNMQSDQRIPIYRGKSFNNQGRTRRFQNKFQNRWTWLLGRGSDRTFMDWSVWEFQFIMYLYGQSVSAASFVCFFSMGQQAKYRQNRNDVYQSVNSSKSSYRLPSFFFISGFNFSMAFSHSDFESIMLFN